MRERQNPRSRSLLSNDVSPTKFGARAHARTIPFSETGDPVQLHMCPGPWALAYRPSRPVYFHPTPAERRSLELAEPPECRSQSSDGIFR
jgi:hypothetical protein